MLTLDEDDYELLGFGSMHEHTLERFELRNRSHHLGFNRRNQRAPPHAIVNAQTPAAKLKRITTRASNRAARRMKNAQRT